MEECEGNSGRSLEQEHLLAAGVCRCGRRGSAVTALDKSAVQAHSCMCFCKAVGLFGEEGGEYSH